MRHRVPNATFTVASFVLAAALHGPAGLAGEGAPQSSAVRPPAPIAPQERPFLSSAVQLTSTEMGLTKAGEAYFSPDGSMIIFQAWPAGKQDYQIYTLQLSSGALHMVSTGKGACTCAYFRPDGRKIIFSSTHLGPGEGLEPAAGDGYTWTFHQHMDVFEADVDGGNLRRLTDQPGYDAEASYSPDGRHIVFTSQRDGDLEIYIMDADGRNPRRLTHGAGYDGGPFFSPDGRTILYRGDRRSDGEMNLQIRMVGADGSGDRAITDNPIFNWCPYWYPSGKGFIFTQVDHSSYTRGERPNYDLFMMSADGGNLTQITFDPQFDGLPVFSPDGRKLMWTSKRGPLENPQVFLADFTLPPALR